MNPDIKAEWLKRLRSGDYQKGVGYLNRNNKFCCLGVLCEMAAEADIVVAMPHREFVRYQSVAYSPDSADRVLPDAVMEWAGLTECNPGFHNVDVDRYGPATAIAGLNDRTTDFVLVAEVIEEQF